MFWVIYIGEIHQPTVEFTFKSHTPVYTMYAQYRVIIKHVLRLKYAAFRFRLLHNQSICLTNDLRSLWLKNVVNPCVPQCMGLYERSQE